MLTTVRCRTNDQGRTLLPGRQKLRQQGVCRHCWHLKDGPKVISQVSCLSLNFPCYSLIFIQKCSVWTQRIWYGITRLFISGRNRYRYRSLPLCSLRSRFRYRSRPRFVHKSVLPSHPLCQVKMWDTLSLQSGTNAQSDNINFVVEFATLVINSPGRTHYDSSPPLW